jgi:hypothetical protein
MKSNEILLEALDIDDSGWEAVVVSVKAARFNALESERLRVSQPAGRTG